MSGAGDCQKAAGGGVKFEVAVTFLVNWWKSFSNKYCEWKLALFNYAMCGPSLEVFPIYEFFSNLTGRHFGSRQILLVHELENWESDFCAKFHWYRSKIEASVVFTRHCYYMYKILKQNLHFCNISNIAVQKFFLFGSRSLSHKYISYEIYLLLVSFSCQLVIHLCCQLSKELEKEYR